MRIRVFSMLLLILVLSLSAVSARADILGVASSYAVIAGSTVTNPTTNANTIVMGDMAVSPGSACTGFVPGTPDICTLGPGLVTGATNLGGGAGTVAAAAAEAAVDNAEAALVATTGAIDLSAQTLGTLGTTASLAPGVYSFNTLTTGLLLGQLTLAGGSNLAPVWIFQIGRDFTTGTGSSVVLTGAGAANAGIYWESAGPSGTQITLGQDTSFLGNLFAGSAVVFDPGAQDLCGGAFADTAVTFAGNDPATSTGRPNLVGPVGCNSGVISGGVVVSGPPIGAPEPGTLALLPFGLLGIIALRFRKAHVSSLSC